MPRQMWHVSSINHQNVRAPPEHEYHDLIHTCPSAKFHSFIYVQTFTHPYAWFDIWSTHSYKGLRTDSHMWLIRAKEMPRYIRCGFIQVICETFVQDAWLHVTWLIHKSSGYTHPVRTWVPWPHSHVPICKLSLIHIYMWFDIYSTRSYMWIRIHLYGWYVKHLCKMPGYMWRGSFINHQSIRTPLEHEYHDPIHACPSANFHSSTHMTRYIEYSFIYVSQDLFIYMAHSCEMPVYMWIDSFINHESIRAPWEHVHHDPIHTCPSANFHVSIYVTQ